MDENGPTLSPPVDLLFKDNFETNDFSLWGYTKLGGGDLSVSTNAAMFGSYGMQAVINDTSSIYVTDDEFVSHETDYRARFYFDPNSITIPNNNGFSILTADGYDSSAFRLMLNRNGGTYKLQAQAYNDAGGTISGQQIVLSDEPHLIEIAFHASTGANDGSFELWIDEVLVDTLSNLDNDTRTISYVDIGATGSIDNGTSGTIFFDEFESRREGYIGPVASVPQLVQAPQSFPTPTTPLAFLPDSIFSNVSLNLPAQQTTTITIDYTYDALRRLTGASYSDGRSFSYLYDANGNTLSYSEQGTVTSYQYDAANQLLTAEKGETLWHYEYDENGSLIEVLPNDTQTNGAKRYTYNTAGLLTQVEAYNGSGWDVQAEMAYNGLNQRLSMDAAGVIAYYVMDTSTGLSASGNRPLTAESNGNTTSYLYGLGVIGEETNAWSYALNDGTNTQRQLTDSAGEVTYSARYTPWGDTLDTYGTGNFAFGYFGGLMDTATGLLYVGEGQYYDPQTGRFLTRNPNASGNPYLPFDPTGALFVPLAFASLIYGKKKKKSKLDVLVIVALLSLSAGLGVAACGNGQQPPAGSTIEAVVTPVSSSTALVTPEVHGTQMPTALVTVPPTTSVTEVLDDICMPEAISSSDTPDQLNINDLENFPRSPETTNVSGVQYYNWYTELWHNKTWWWWTDHNTFSIWDFITLILYLELDKIGNPSIPNMHAGFSAYQEAVVRVIYQDCKEKGCVGGSPEATLNWLAGYSESGSKLFYSSKIPNLKDNPYSSAKILVNSIRNPANCGVPDWARGFLTTRPYGVANKSNFKNVPKAFDYASNQGQIFWRSGKDTGDEVIIPTGCGDYILHYDIANYERLCGKDGRPAIWPTHLDEVR